MAAGTLTGYRKKRDFTRTAEPTGDDKAVLPSTRLRFVVQKHDATRLHFDLRLEYDGVFRSWAVTRGPSLDPHDRRLAVEVEDHPLDYGDFEGTIPQGQYGGGTVQLWDRGYWAPEPGFEDIGKSLDKGELKFVMEGQRLHGGWVLVRLRDDAKAKRHNWLLIKHRDAAAQAGRGEDLATQDRSVASGRSMAQIATGKGRAPTPFMTAGEKQSDRVWQTDKPAKSTAERPRPASAKAASKQPPRGAPNMPDFIAPQLCKRVEKPPAGDGWAHEIKFDGYRMQLRVQHGTATLLTRSGLDWTAKFAAIAKAAAGLPDGIIDGEVVALDHTGAPSFAALQAAIAEEQTKNLIFFAFDMLFCRGHDLRNETLRERKQQLAEMLAGAAPQLRYVDHFTAAGDAVLQSACRMDLEGIVSKRLDAPYRSGRGDTWVKSKCRQGHEVVIGGWTTTGSAFRSLLAGVYHAGKLRYVGRIGTGFGRKVADTLLPQLQAVAAQSSPFSGEAAPKAADGVHWAHPELVAEIEYAGFTADGALRQAAFKGLRQDKPPRDVQAETPAPPASTTLPGVAAASAPVRAGGSAAVLGVTISHAGKILWPASAHGAAVSKLDLANYYQAVGGWLIEHIKGRPCSLIRMPDGIDGQRFFQRHTSRGNSALFTEARVSGDRQPYIQLDSVEAVIAAAQAGTVELHPWNCAPGKPDQPGRLVFDLDPAPEVDFAAVVVAAQDVRRRLEKLGLVPFCKTTGGKGLHVVVPILAQGVDWPGAKAFARHFCQAMQTQHPDLYLINMSKQQRAGKIFLDYLRNDRMATAVAPLSPRGRPGAPVSMPLTWQQVRKGLDPSAYTIHTVPRLLKRTSAWKDYAAGARSLPVAIARQDGKRTA